jgi:UDP-glucose 4-epimerase
MGFHKFIEAMRTGRDITVYGDGLQTRDYTYVADIVRANIAAAASDATGEVFNIGGGSRVVLRTVFELLERYLGVQARLVYHATQRGDVDHTGADTSRAQAVLGYRPTVSLEEGLHAQVTWHTTVLHGVDLPASVAQRAGPSSHAATGLALATAHQPECYRS